MPNVIWGKVQAQLFMTTSTRQFMRPDIGLCHVVCLNLFVCQVMQVLCIEKYALF